MLLPAEGTTVLNYNDSGFRVYDDKGKWTIDLWWWIIRIDSYTESFCVVHQSKDCVLDGPVMPLFCVASHHSSKYRYHWDNVKGNVGLYGPVLYVTKSGTYRCTVENKDNGAKCRSGSIHVADGMTKFSACMIVYLVLWYFKGRNYRGCILI